MNDGVSPEVVRWRPAYCPTCRAEYPVPADAYEDIVSRGDVIHCPKGHKIQTRGEAPKVVKAQPADARRSSNPKRIRTAAPRAAAPAPAVQQRYCAYCRTDTTHSRIAGSPVWRCERATAHPEHALHWLEEAVADFRRRSDDVDALNDELGELQSRVSDLEERLEALPPPPDAPGPPSQPPPAPAPEADSRPEAFEAPPLWPSPGPFEDD